MSFLFALCFSKNPNRAFHDAQAGDTFEDQFEDLSPNSVERRLEMDADPLLSIKRRNLTYSTELLEANIDFSR